MIFKALIGTALLMSGSFGLANGVANAAEFSKEQKAEIQDLIRETVIQNPDMIVEALENYQVQQERLQNEAALRAASKHRSYFLDAKTTPYAGNEDAPVIVVEFFDYLCGYCKRAADAVQDVLDAGKDVRVVFIEMPILSPASTEAAKWALAAHEQGKYFEYHIAIMEDKSRKSAKDLERLAKKVGLNVRQLKKDKDSPEIQEKINRNLSIAREIGINGTPGFIINDTVVRGYIDSGQMKKIIDEKAAQSTKNKG